jgi:3-dehydroquinate synthase
MKPLDTVAVSLGARSYRILIGGGLLKDLGEMCAELPLARRAVIVTNAAVRRLYGAGVKSSLSRAGFNAVFAQVPNGERAKSLPQTARLYRAFLLHRMDRRSAVIALGGGVIGDLAGYAAATFLRGLPLIQVPTTLLGQVDSSVGGKTGVNLPEGKNLVGAFHQPSLVVADIETLKSLPRRHLRAGLSEVVKYGMIADAELFTYIEAHLDQILRAEEGALAFLVARSCAIKARVVEQDEREEGLRAILNFGHTVGHAIEAASGYRRLLHGEAVAIGMVVATGLSVMRGLCGQEELERLRSLLRKIGLPTIPDVDFNILLKSIGYDKKVRNNMIYFVLTKGIGHAMVAPISDRRELRRAVALAGASS